MSHASGVDLDDLEAIDRLDSEGVLDAVERFADQVREAWYIGKAVEALPEPAGVDSIVVLGMGGSGVSGDVTQVLVEERLSIFFRVIKGYGPLPHWVGRNTLVFAVSYSGNTEETLSAFEEAHERGARIVAVSSGGALAERAQRYGVAHVAIPSGLQPRASLGYLTLPILGVLVQMGLVPDVEDDVHETVQVLADIAGRCQRKSPLAENQSKQLAAEIHGKVPVIYGGRGLAATAAMRFKCDLNEYAKTPAFWNEVPELDHNEIVGWNRLRDLTAARFLLVLLRDSDEEDRIALRMRITRALIDESFAGIVEVASEGRSSLARLMSLVVITQLAAIYTGLAYGIDPGPVEVISKLKNELAQA